MTKISHSCHSSDVPNAICKSSHGTLYLFSAHALVALEWRYKRDLHIIKLLKESKY